MDVVNKFNVNNKQVTLDADIIENMSADDVSYNSSLQYGENTVGDKLSELGSEIGKIRKEVCKIVDEKALSSNYYIFSSKFEVKEDVKYTIKLKIPNYKSDINDNIKLRTSSEDITPELKFGVKSFDDYVDIDLIPTVTSNNAYVAIYGSKISPGDYEAEIIVFDNSIDLYWHGENIRFNTKEINENKIRLNDTETRLDYLDDAESLQKNKIKIIDYGEWLPKKNNSGGVIIQGYTNYVFNVEGLSCIFVDAIIGCTSEVATISTASSNDKKGLIRVIKEGTGNNESISQKILLENNEKILFVVCPNEHIPLVKETYKQKEINQFVIDLQENIPTEYEVIGNETYMLFIRNIPVQKNTTYKISLKSNVDFTFDPNGNFKFVYSNKEYGPEQSLAKINISDWVTKTYESKYDDTVTLSIYNNSIFNNDVIIDVKIVEENTYKYISSLVTKIPRQELELNNIKKYSIEGVGHYEGENNFRFPNEYSYKKILEYKDSSLNNSSWAGGMALYDKYAVVLYNGGYMAIFDIYNKELLAYGATSTNSADNHYNCGIFTNQILEDDLLPIIYTSKCKTGSSDCYVERIKIDGKHLTTELLQTITCSSNIMPSDKDCDWLIDKKTNSLVMLYTSGTNTIKSVYFNMPNLDIANVELTTSDIIEEIEVYDIYITARQGSFVYDKMLYYAQGVDRQQLAIIDLNTQSIVTKIDLSPLTTGEIEAVYVYGKKIYANAHTVNGLEIKLYELNF